MKVASVDYKKINVVDEVSMLSETQENVKLSILDDDNIIIECNGKLKHFEEVKSSCKDRSQDSIQSYSFKGESFGKMISGKIYTNGWVEISFEGVDKPLMYVPTSKKVEKF